LNHKEHEDHKEKNVARECAPFILAVFGDRLTRIAPAAITLFFQIDSEPWGPIFP
jgi:hypothetical protein